MRVQTTNVVNGGKRIFIFTVNVNVISYCFLLTVILLSLDISLFSSPEQKGQGELL